MRQWIKAFVHNCLVHPLMMVLPCELGTRLHDRNANWAFGLDRYDEIGIEEGKLLERLNEALILRAQADAIEAAVRSGEGMYDFAQILREQAELKEEKKS